MKHRNKPLEPEIERRGEFEPRLPKSVTSRHSGLLSRLKLLGRSAAGSKAKRLGRRSTGARGKIRAPRAFTQRAIVKARVVKGDGKKAVQRLRAHLSYLNRSGTGLTGERPEFFNQEQYLSRTELSKRAAEWAKDAHHFRFIISPERASELELESYVKKVVSTMEQDLKTKLEWYATCHYNTDNPHAHIVIRGIDETGETLFLSRDYLSHGVRQIAEQEATLRLGKRGPGEVQKGIEKALKQDSFTFMDKELSLMQERSPDKTVTLEPLLGAVREWERKARDNKLKRLAFLEGKGLARELKAGAWKVDDNLETVLRELTEKRRVEQLISPLLSKSEARKQELIIHKESEPFALNLQGLVLAKELSDELYDKRFILLNADDGRTHFIPVGKFSEPQGFESRVGQVVTVTPPREHPIKAEKVISEYLKGHAGVFDIESFKQHVHQATQSGRWTVPDSMTVEEYCEMFATRCDTLTRAGILTNVSEGKWEVPIDVEAQAKGYEELTRKKLRVAIKVDSYTQLSEQSTSPNAVWLDKLFYSSEVLSKSRGTYRIEVERELSKRKQFLGERGTRIEKGVFYELLRVDERKLKEGLEKRLGREQFMKGGEEIAGKVIGYELLGDGYRMIAKTELGYVMRKVGKRESQLPFNSEVTLSKSVKTFGGRSKEIIKAKPVSTSRTKQRTKGRR